MTRSREEPAAAADAPADRNRSKLKVWLLIVAAALVVSLAALAFVSWQLFKAKALEREMEQVLEAASLFVAELTTYSHETVDEDIAQVLRLSTGTFHEEYRTALGGEAFKKALLEAKGTSKGDVVSIAVSELADERSTVIAVVDQVVVNQSQTEPRTERRRLEILMIKTSAGWKTDKVTVL